MYKTKNIKRSFKVLSNILFDMNNIYNLFFVSLFVFKMNDMHFLERKESKKLYGLGN